MADCIVCGGWFSSSNRTDELCPTCERAVKRLKGYAVPVVRCKECKHRTYIEAIGEHWCTHARGLCGFVHDDEFCPYGERREENAVD